MRGAPLLGLLAFVLSATLLAHVERGEAQRSRQQSEGTGKVQPALKDIPLPERPTDPPKTAPTKSADKKPGEENSKDARDEAAEESPPADEWPQEEIARALRECVRLLAPIAAEVDVTVPIKSGACGAPAPVLLRKIGVQKPVTLSPPATLNCPMVVALHKWVETRLQPQAQRLLGSRIVSLSNVSAYSCRLRNGSRTRKLSEHALANAIDIGKFETADGQVISLSKDWGPTKRDIRQSVAETSQEKGSQAESKKAIAVQATVPPARPSRKAMRKSRSVRLKDIPLPVRRPDPAIAAEGEKAAAAERAKPAAGKAVQRLEAATSIQARFLKQIHQEACEIFGTVLGPEANDAHRDHFHFDLATRRSRAYCE